MRQKKNIKGNIIARHNGFYSKSSSFSSAVSLDTVFSKGMNVMDNQKVLQTCGCIRSDKRLDTEITQSRKSCLTQGT